MTSTLLPYRWLLGLAVLATALPQAQAALIDRGGGLIYDTVLNVTWLQDSNYAATSGYQVPGRAPDDPMVNGNLSWAEAVTWAQNLSYYDAVRNVTWTEWHLPAASPVGGGPTMVSAVNTNGSSDDSYNISAPGSMYPGSTASQLAYMYFNNLGNVAACPPDLGFSGCRDPLLPRVVPFTFGPFLNPQQMYWTASNADVPFHDAWAFDFLASTYGAQCACAAYDSWDVRRTAWAVMDGDVAALAPVPEVSSLVLLLSGISVGWLAVARRNFRGKDLLLRPT